MPFAYWYEISKEDYDNFGTEELDALADEFLAGINEDRLICRERLFPKSEPQNPAVKIVVALLICALFVVLTFIFLKESSKNKPTATSFSYPEESIFLNEILDSDN